MIQQIEVLLIEDSPSDAEFTIRTLTQNKFVNKLLHLKDGSEALDYLFAEGIYMNRNIENTPGLILLDLKMPKVGGKVVLQRVKSDIRTKKIPVVILTSSKEDPDIQECYLLGANSYVVKPVEFEAFYKAVVNLGLYWMTTNQSPQ